MNKELEWDISDPQKIDEYNNIVDGGEIFGPICPDDGYFMWATANIDVFGEIVIYGDGITKRSARADLSRNIKKFMEMFNG